MTGEPTHTASKEGIVSCAPVINYGLRCSIHYASLLANYTALRIKNCSKCASAIKIATMKNMDDFCYTNLGKPSRAIAKVFISALRCPIKNHEMPREIHLCYQNSHYGNTDNFHYKPREAIAQLAIATTESTLCTVSKDEWDTKEDNGKSMKNAWYALWHTKRHISGQSDVEQ